MRLTLTRDGMRERKSEEPELGQRFLTEQLDRSCYKATDQKEALLCGCPVKVPGAEGSSWHGVIRKCFGEGLSFELELEEVDEEDDGPPQNSYLNTTNETRL